MPLVSTELGYQLGLSLLICSPVIVSAFWVGTMLRRKVNLYEMFGLILFWAAAVSLLGICFNRMPGPFQYAGGVYPPSSPVPPTTYYQPPSLPPGTLVPAPPPGSLVPATPQPTGTPPGASAAPEESREK